MKEMIVVLSIVIFGLLIFIVYLSYEVKSNIKDFNNFKSESENIISDLEDEIQSLTGIVNIEEIDYSMVPYIEDSYGNKTYQGVWYGNIPLSLDTNIKKVLYLILDELDLKIVQTKEQKTESKLILRSKTETD